MKKKAAIRIPKPLYRQKRQPRKKASQQIEAANQERGVDKSFALHEAAELPKHSALRCVELFAGAGGLALAASKAGFEHDAVLELNHAACETIRSNQRRGYKLVSHWPLIEGDVHKQDFSTWHRRADIVSGGPPCQPFSIGGKHRAMHDYRNLFPEAARAVREIQPRAFVFENVKGLTRQSFAKYFSHIVLQLTYPGVQRLEHEDWPEHLARLERIRTEGATTGLAPQHLFPPSILDRS
jgi:DNA (cytosine-5)-methyltransferase 1